MSKEASAPRRFTKRLLIANTAAAWLAIGLSIWLGAAETVVPAMTFMIASLIGVYTGTGHLDYRAYLRGAGETK